MRYPHESRKAAPTGTAGAEGGREAYREKKDASAARQGRRRAGSMRTWARAGTSSHFTVWPAPWLQNTESGVFGRSASGS